MNATLKERVERDVVEALGDFDLPLAEPFGPAEAFLIAGMMFTMAGCVMWWRMWAWR